MAATANKTFNKHRAQFLLVAFDGSGDGAVVSFVDGESVIWIVPVDGAFVDWRRCNHLASRYQDRYEEDQRGDSFVSRQSHQVVLPVSKVMSAIR